MEHNSICLKSITDLGGNRFYIPSYQRGYRWVRQQVVDLLDDIWEFSQTGSSTFYCLQPVIVKDRNGMWELIDGQQRLTTIYIILAYLRRRTFSLEFETRTKSEEFLLQLHSGIDSSNIDFFHISHAYMYITDWFEQKKKKKANGVEVEEAFFQTLGWDTQVIWYQINDGSDPRDIFTRINVGKIRLTNAELIRALFLQSGNFGQDAEKVRLKQLEIASEWNHIERSLQDNRFWYFINKGANRLPTRIEFLFNIIAQKQDSYDEDFTFRYYLQRFQTTTLKEINTIWKEVKDYFLLLEEWFNNGELYHLIGYLITIGMPLSKLISEYGKLHTKKEFRVYLKEEIKKRVSYSIDKLDFETNNPDKAIEKILLLFNVATLLQNQNATYRFPFNEYKGNGISKKSWSLEHIHAQRSKGLDTTERRKKWLEETKKAMVKMGVTPAPLFRELESLLQVDTIDKASFEVLQEKIVSLFGEPNLHSVDNLTLLTVNDNSFLNNSIFPVKREKIIELEKEGSFIPICTRNVFLKYYTSNATHLHYWSEEDRVGYINAIKKKLKEYLPEEEKPVAHGTN